MSADWRADILKFWFSLSDEDHWSGSPEIDHRVRQQFLKLWAEKRQLPAAAFVTDPLTALAAVILFDQFSRHFFRGNAEQFATDHLALAVAKAAVDKGLDAQLEVPERSFLYMPFQHSEALADQKRSLLLFTELGDARMLRYAKLHHDVIDRFGRFPHRNAMLGRQPRSEEAAAGDIVPW